MTERHQQSSAESCDLKPCPFCGPGRSMVDPWFDDVSKRWAIGCGRCGASSGRSIHAKGSKEAAIKSWNTRGLTGDAAQPTVDQQLEEAGKGVIAIRNELDRTRAERDSWEAQFHSAAAAASEYSAFWEKHQRNFDQFGNYIPHSQIDGDLRAAKRKIAELEAAAHSRSSAGNESDIDQKLGELLAKICSHEAVDEAMEASWNDICSDTGCHPLDIEHGKGEHLTFSPNHWANQVAKRLFVRALKLRLEMPGEPQTAAVRLRPMSEAPKDREIFALHYNRDCYGCADRSRPDAGNFHPIQWKERPWEPNYRPRWGMRWNDEYNVTLNDFAGWIDPADLPSALTRPNRESGK